MTITWGLFSLQSWDLGSTVSWVLVGGSCFTSSFYVLSFRWYNFLWFYECLFAAVGCGYCFFLVWDSLGLTSGFGSRGIHGEPMKFFGLPVICLDGSRGSHVSCTCCRDSESVGFRIWQS